MMWRTPCDTQGVEGHMSMWSLLVMQLAAEVDRRDVGWRESDLICLMFLLLTNLTLGGKSKMAVNSSAMKGLNLEKCFLYCIKASCLVEMYIFR